ncbi:AraC family transcriptional regulator [Microbacterium sp. RD1]|uniref:AraC family transcriptional regulator n=1 Tax=Microbacterium sp. RD1 TaxID=3457313 RepID=UPI003FA5E12E
MFESFAELDFETAEASRFSGRLWNSMIGPTGVIALHGSSLTAYRRQEHVRADPSPLTTVIWQLSGVSSARQDEEEVVFRAGDVVFLDRAVEYVVECVTPFEQLVFSVPTESLTAHLPEAARETPLHAAVRRPDVLSRPWRTYLWDLSLAALHNPTVDFRTHSQGLTDALGAIAASEGPTAATGGKERVVESTEIVAHIASTAHDPDLTAEQTARRLLISRRTLFRTLRAAGLNYRDVLLEARFERARTLLADGGRSRSIATIAIESGFGSVSHFHTVFRERFGCTPAQFRDGATSPNASTARP